MARSTKKRLVAEAVASTAAGGAWPWILTKFMPRRWRMRTLFLLFAVLMSLGIVKLKWTDDAPGLQIDLKRSVQIEQNAEQFLKAAKDRLQKNR